MILVSSKVTEKNHNFKTLLDFGKLHKNYDIICICFFFFFAIADLKFLMDRVTQQIKKNLALPATLKFLEIKEKKDKVTGKVIEML